jgi:hypothetical protein
MSATVGSGALLRHTSGLRPRCSCSAKPLVDRLIPRAEVIDIDADSYRLEEAKELTAARSTLLSKKSAS